MKNKFLLITTALLLTTSLSACSITNQSPNNQDAPDMANPSSEMINILELKFKDSAHVDSIETNKEISGFAKDETIKGTLIKGENEGKKFEMVLCENKVDEVHDDVKILINDNKCLLVKGDDGSLEAFGGTLSAEEKVKANLAENFKEVFDRGIDLAERGTIQEIQKHGIVKF